MGKLTGQLHTCTARSIDPPWGNTTLHSPLHRYGTCERGRSGRVWSTTTLITEQIAADEALCPIARPWICQVNGGERETTGARSLPRVNCKNEHPQPC